MCPYMGSDVNEEGSPWTGEREGECEEEECGWWPEDSCIVPGDLIPALIDEADDVPSEEYLRNQDNWVSCEYAEQCQWQQQGDGDFPCPPRLAVMLNLDPSKCLF